MDTRISRGVAMLVVSSVVAVTACNRAVAMESYADCVLAHVTEGMDERAVSVISSACRTKFAASAEAEAEDPAAEPLSATAVEELTFRARRANDQMLLGVLHNGNPDTTVTEVEFVVTAMLDGVEQDRTYRTRTVVAPLGTSNLQLTVLPPDPGTEFTWEVTAARGRPSQ